MKWSREIKKLGEICKTGAGGTPLKSHKDYYEGGDVPWLLSGEVGQGEIYQVKNFITKKGLDNSSAKLFPPNTVLIAMYGATAGQVGILRIEAATNQAVCGIYPNDKLLPEFIYYCFLAKKEELVSQAVGNAQPNISQSKIRNTEVPILPLPEQKQIVAILDEAFEAIDQARANIEKNIQNAQELFQSKLNEVFFQQEDGWISKKLGELIEVKHGYAFKSKFFTHDGDFVLLTPGNFFEEGGYRDRGEKQKYYVGEIPNGFILEKNDLLVAMTEQAPGLLGSPLMVPKSGCFLHNQRLGLIKTKEGITLLNGFLFFLFNSSSFRDEVYKSGTGVKVRHTSPTKICDVTVNITFNKIHQEEIVKKLDLIRKNTKSLSAQYEIKLKELEELKKSLLQKAFSGELTKNFTEEVKDLVTS